MPVDAAQPARVRIAFIIVHYRTPGLLRDCIASLLPEIDREHDQVIVVDNASPDGSGPTLRDIQGITLIESPVNLGFAGANNVGIEHVDADYYCLLNPDTIIRPGAIAKLFDFLQHHPEAAMVGPRLEDPDGTPQYSAFGDPTPVSELIRGSNLGIVTRLLRRWQVYGAMPQQPTRVDWVAGACLLMRRAVIDSVGLLDSGYFMYFEEVDFCRRARHAGHTCWYLPEARVVHLVGQASGITNTKQRKRLPAYWFEARHRYYRKHFGYFGTAFADLLWLSGAFVDRIRKLLTGVSHSSLAHKEISDFIRFEARFLASGRTPEHIAPPITPVGAA